MSQGIWFCYDGNGHGFQLFESAEFAKAAAEKALSEERSNARNEHGWPPEGVDICWGQVVGQARPSGEILTIPDYGLESIT